MKKEIFFNEFRQEHREIRDLLFDMITSFGEQDFSKSFLIMQGINHLKHFTRHRLKMLVADIGLLPM